MEQERCRVKRQIVKRLISMVLILLGLTWVTFLLMYLSPSDPVRIQLAGQGIPPDPEVAAQMRHELGLDRPFIVQYLYWIGGVLHGDLGYSVKYGVPVAALIKEAVPRTMALAGASLALAFLITVPLSLAAFRQRNRFWDYAIRFFSFVSLSMPTFWLGLLLIYFFSVRLRWIPVDTSGPEGLILPSVTLALWLSGLYIRRIRSALLEEYRKSYITGARALGLGKSSVLWKYLMPNSLPAVITMLGMTAGNLLGGAAVAETIFGWRGMGELMTEAVLARDYQLMQAYILWGAGIFVIMNFAADCLCLCLDPRRSQEKGGGAL